jgi:hypothetical protein
VPGSKEGEGTLMVISMTIFAIEKSSMESQKV